MNEGAEKLLQYPFLTLVRVSRTPFLAFSARSGITGSRVRRAHGAIDSAIKGYVALCGLVRKREGRVGRLVAPRGEEAIPDKRSLGPTRKPGYWHEAEALTLLEETEYLVGELLKGGIPFPERAEYYRAISRARQARDWGAYEKTPCPPTAAAREGPWRKRAGKRGAASSGRGGFARRHTPRPLGE